MIPIKNFQNVNQNLRIHHDLNLAFKIKYPIKSLPLKIHESKRSSLRKKLLY